MGSRLRNNISGAPFLSSSWGKSRGVEDMQNFWLDIVILSVSHRVCTEVSHLLLRCYRVENGGVNVMNLEISRSKNGAIQKVLIRMGLILVSGKELRVYGMNERFHVITTVHVVRKDYISISDTNVKQLLCLVIRFRIMAKAHVLKEIVDRHVCPKVGVGESGRNNLFS